MRKQDRTHKPSKRFAELTKKNSSETLYDPAEAIAVVKTTATAKFDETIDAAVNLGVDPRHGDQMVRGVTNLPHGTGKSRKVLVFAKAQKAADAEAAGADLVGAEELVEQVQKEQLDWKQYDLILATPDMMAQVGRLGATFKAKMPNPKAGTVSANIGQAVTEIKKATRVEYRVEKGGIVHVPIGKASFTPEALLENYNAIIDALVKAKPSSSKGRYLRKVSISATMGPTVSIDPLKAQTVVRV